MSGRRTFFAAICMLFGAATLVHAQSPQAPTRQGIPSVIPDSRAPARADAEDMIAQEDLSWGIVHSAWIIHRDGDGFLDDDRNHPQNRFHVPAEIFDQVKALLDRAHEIDVSNTNCEPFATDGPYGQYYWRIGGHAVRLSWTTAQRCERDQDVYEPLRQADDLVWRLVHPEQP